MYITQGSFRPNNKSNVCRAGHDLKCQTCEDDDFINYKSPGDLHISEVLPTTHDASTMGSAFLWPLLESATCLNLEQRLLTD
mmetsp:Transcript_96235/g.151589  ORF Transcript_96235/g.151589 Transcript_96235/m.151589 type:complete len:82 (-) Transcript_96235:1221-1466(-)